MVLAVRSRGGKINWTKGWPQTEGEISVHWKRCGRKRMKCQTERAGKQHEATQELGRALSDGRHGWEKSEASPALVEIFLVGASAFCQRGKVLCRVLWHRGMSPCVGAVRYAVTGCRSAAQRDRMAGKACGGRTWWRIFGRVISGGRTTAARYDWVFEHPLFAAINPRQARKTVSGRRCAG